jgi:hypothetical protein
MEDHNTGLALLSGILFRMQCIKLAMVTKANAKGQGGRGRTDAYNREIFERQCGMHIMSPQEKKVKWAQPAVIAKFDAFKVDNRWLVQSRNRLMDLYNLVCAICFDARLCCHSFQFGFAAILDPAFTPSKRNAGAKSTKRYMDHLDRELTRLDASNLAYVQEHGSQEDAHHTRADRSGHAEVILTFIVSNLGLNKLVTYIANFRQRYRPAVDPEFRYTTLDRVVEDEVGVGRGTSDDPIEWPPTPDPRGHGTYNDPQGTEEDEDEEVD